MDRSSSSTQHPTPFTFEAMPNEIHSMILDKIPDWNRPAGLPTMRSVSCVNRQIRAIAMPFLMECYVSKLEVAMSAISSDKKADTIAELEDWLTTHANQMPTMALVDALTRTRKLTDALSVVELGPVFRENKMMCPANSDTSFSVNDLITMQMALASFSSTCSKMASHLNERTDEIKKAHFG